MSVKRWMGTPPTTCQLCTKELEDNFIDGKTRFGPWATMCNTCHSIHGCGLGTGVGQRYDLKTLVKVDG